MTLDDIGLFWTEIEADFQAVYQISHPLRLTWRKFMVLLTGLPHDSRLHIMRQYSDPRAALRRHMGHDNVPRQRVSVEDFLKEMSSGG